MDLQHWCYRNANYPATYAPIESDPAFKPGLRWFAWYMKDWKALIYSKFSCMLHFGSLVDWTEVLDKKYWSAFSVISRFEHMLFFYSISQCSLWAPSHLTTQRWLRPPLWLHGHLPQGLALRYIADVPNLLWYSPLVPSCFWIWLKQDVSRIGWLGFCPVSVHTSLATLSGHHNTSASLNCWKDGLRL